MPEEVSLPLIPDIPLSGKTTGILPDKGRQIRFGRSLHQYMDMIIHQTDAQHLDIVLPGYGTE